jgi:hypothetical protein
LGGAFWEGHPKYTYCYHQNLPYYLHIYCSVYPRTPLVLRSTNKQLLESCRPDLALRRNLHSRLFGFQLLHYLAEALNKPRPDLNFISRSVLSSTQTKFGAVRISFIIYVLLWRPIVRAACNIHYTFLSQLIDLLGAVSLTVPRNGWSPFKTVQRRS